MAGDGERGWEEGEGVEEIEEDVQCYDGLDEAG